MSDVTNANDTQVTSEQTPQTQTQTQTQGQSNGMPDLTNPENEAAMVKVLQSNPNLIPGNFNGDAAAAVASMKAAQAKITEQANQIKELKSQTQAVNNPDEDNSSEVPASSETVDSLKIPEPDSANAADSAGNTSVITAARKEFIETGDFSEATIENLTKAGFAAEDVQYIRNGLIAQRQADVNRAAEMVGGNENLKAILQHASTYDEAERNRINEGLQGPYAAEVLMGLKARWEASGGNAQAKAEQQASQKPAVQTGNVAQSKNSNPHNFTLPQDPADRMNYIKGLMSTPQYRNDPVYREEVMGLLAESQTISRTAPGRPMVIGGFGD